ncbi:hypothetical protein EDB85DRAFT_2144590 [Lactarius pseudohatsudake]|nr:hypothetical protein EDB85DRAFT_671354 [Lactarius pseudohatsudake]KAH9034105.1 hypothetical protein EDB85DRAFT_2144590 [Lactarius pseudohatsudake]
MRTHRSTSATSTGGRSSTPEASQIANAKFDVRVCRRWIFEDKFATIMDPRPQASGSWSSSGVARLWQMAMSPVRGSSSHTRCSMRATTCSALGARQLYALEQQNLRREPGAPQLLQFIVRVPSFAVFDHRYLDVYFVPGFYKVLNKEVNPKGLEVADYGLYYLDVGERYNGCARRDMTLPVTEGWVDEYAVVELRPGGITQDMTRANKEEYYVNLISVHQNARQIAEQFRVSMEGTCCC